jgi:hypothetical protein
MLTTCTSASFLTAKAPAPTSDAVESGYSGNSSEFIDYSKEQDLELSLSEDLGQSISG